MRTPITETSDTPGKIIVFVRTDNDDSALQFSITYKIQPEGYPNHIRPIEIVPIRPRQNSRSAAGILIPDTIVAESITRVIHYFRYVTTHLSERKTHPLPFEKWNKLNGST